MLTLVCAAWQPIVEDDFWWHLRAGNDILAGRGIPSVDRWSFTSAGQPYVDLHWGFQAILAFVTSKAGIDGAIAFKIVLLAATFWIVYRLAAWPASPALAAALTGLGVILASERFLVRPEIATFLLLAVTLELLMRHEQGSSRAWMLLPLVTLVWVNVEGLFVLGLVAVACHIAGRPADRRLWGALGLSVLASVVNPFGLTGALHPFVLFTRISGSMAIYSRTIGEFVGPLAGGPWYPTVALYPWFLGLIAASLVVYAKRPPLREILLLAAFVYLSLRARRNLALLAIVAVPIVARWIGAGRGAGWLRRLLDRIPLTARRVTATVASAIVAVGFLAYDVALVNGSIYARAGTNRSFGGGVAEGSAPLKAAEFLRTNDVHGPLFNAFAWGGYLIDTVPGLPVFIDGRLEVHSADLYASYLDAAGGGDRWKAADARYGFRCLVLDFTQTPRLVGERLEDPAWAPVALDGSAIVFLKNDDANRATIDRFRLTPERLRAAYPVAAPAAAAGLPDTGSNGFLARSFRHEPVPWHEMFQGEYFDFLQLPDLAAGQYAAAIRRAPHALTPRVALAGAIGDMGSAEDGLRVAEGARSLARTGDERRELAEVIARLRGASAR